MENRIPALFRQPSSVPRSAQIRRDLILDLIPYLAALTLCFTTFAACAEDDLPTGGADRPLDFEPSLMLDSPAPSLPDRETDAEPDVAALAAKLERAKKQATWSEGLARRGLIAKIEAEKRALEVVRRTCDLEKARLAAAQRHLQALRAGSASVEPPTPDLLAAETAVQSAQTTAQEAADRWNAAELEAAELDVKRRRQLLSAGVATRAEVKRAEEKLAAVRAGHSEPRFVSP